MEHCSDKRGSGTPDNRDSDNPGSYCNTIISGRDSCFSLYAIAIATPVPYVNENRSREAKTINRLDTQVKVSYYYTSEIFFGMAQNRTTDYGLGLII